MFRLCAHPNIVKNWSLFQEKSLNLVTFFCLSDPWKSWGFEVWVAHPHPNQIWVPPPPVEAFLSRTNFGNLALLSYFLYHSNLVSVLERFKIISSCCGISLFWNEPEAEILILLKIHTPKNKTKQNKTKVSHQTNQRHCRQEGNYLWCLKPSPDCPFQNFAC